MNEIEALDLLKDPNTPRDIIMQILNEVDKIVSPYIKKPLVYRNLNTKLSLKLSKGVRKSSIIEKCILHPNFDISLWKELLEKKSHLRNYKIVALFKRTDLPREAFETGVNMNRSVRREIALNPSCPEHILRQLMKDKDPLVRRRIAQNPSTPLEMLEELKNDDYAIYGLAANPKLPLDWMQELVFHPEAEVRYNLCQNPSIPSSILFVLLNDSSDLVRKRAQLEYRNRSLK